MIDLVKQQILNWVEGNRAGDRETDACFWSLYTLKSVYSAPYKNQAPLVENYEVSEKGESIDYLLGHMANTPHVRYYAVKLRKEKGDNGVTCNFMNPHYSAGSSSGIAGISANNKMGDNTLMSVVALLEKSTENRMAAKDENTQLMFQMLQQQNTAQIASLRKELSLESKIKALEEENAALKNVQPDSFIREVWKDVGPEVKDFMKWHLSDQKGYEQISGEHEEDEHSDIKQIENEDLLNQSVDLLGQSVGRPEEWIYKLAFVLNQSDEKTANNLIRMLESKYQDYKKQAENGK